MKLTTKIVLGIIISIFLLSFCVIIGISFIDTDKYESRLSGYRPTISQENIIAVDVELYQTIKVDQVQIQEERSVYLSGTIRLIPVINQEDKNKLLLPEELLRFTDITSSSDTLIIRLNTSALYEQYMTNKDKEENTYSTNTIDGINFFAHTNNIDVICNVSGIKTDVRNIITDKININTNGEIEIDSCQANLVEPYIKSNSRRFLLKNSQVKELNIDLDQIGTSWKIENCDIEVENLTGSGNRRISFPKIETKIMNWIPKDKDAQLTVTLYGDTASIVFP